MSKKILSLLVVAIFLVSALGVGVELAYAQRTDAAHCQVYSKGGATPDARKYYNCLKKVQVKRKFDKLAFNMEKQIDQLRSRADEIQVRIDQASATRDVTQAQTLLNQARALLDEASSDLAAAKPLTETIKDYATGADASAVLSPIFNAIKVKINQARSLLKQANQALKV